jgi:hypothetical protein
LEKALGPEHRKVTTCLENYAVLLREMDRPEDAEPLESRFEKQVTFQVLR